MLVRPVRVQTLDGIGDIAQAAYEWIMAATLAGDQRGQYLIKPLESKLTTEQIQRAKDRARVLYSDKGSSQVSAQAFLQ